MTKESHAWEDMRRSLACAGEKGPQSIPLLTLDGEFGEKGWAVAATPSLHIMNLALCLKILVLSSWFNQSIGWV